MTVLKGALTALVLLAIGRSVVVGQDYNALLKEVDKIETNLKELIGKETTTLQKGSQKLQADVKQLQQTPGVGSDNPAFAQVVQEIQALRAEVTRLSAQTSQSSVSEADLAAMASDIALLKAELATLQANNSENQKLLASLNDEGVYLPSNNSSQPPATQQSQVPGVNFTGFVDASNYTNHNVGESSFGLDQVEIDVVKEFSGRASVRADIEYVNDGQGGFSFDLEQGYMVWNAGSSWKWEFTFGKFNAPIGFESVDPTGMYQYSFGLVSAYCIPGNLTGVMVSLAAPKLMKWSLFAVNGWDVNTDNNKDKTIGTHLAFSPLNNLSFSLSALTGPELEDNNISRRSVLDCNLTYNPLPFWTVGGELNMGWESKVLADNGTARWGGFLLMNNFQITQRYGITARLDYLNDYDGSRTNTSQELKAFCISPSVKIVDGLSGLFEVRYDWSDHDTFAGGDNTVRSHQASTAFEFTYGF
jgi:hypothetical protein